MALKFLLANHLHPQMLYDLDPWAPWIQGFATGMRDEG